MAELLMRLGQIGPLPLTWKRSVLRRFGVADNPERFGLRQVTPKRHAREAFEHVRRQNGLTRCERNFPVHAMQTVEPKLRIEGRGIVVHVDKVMIEGRLIEELVEKAKDLGWAAGKKSIVDDHQPISEI